MSISSIFYAGLMWGAYRLGHFNATRPGEAKEHVNRAWAHFQAWLKTRK